jgi:NRAMP (natural resistance-associated macrophage protein)-like metal ion transporter
MHTPQDFKRDIDLEQVAPRPPKKNILRLLGPGLITGASDDDPSGIATYSQAGAQFGFSVLWTTILTFPLMAAVQRISGEIGRVTGHGLAGNMRLHFPRWLTALCLTAMLFANVINIGADISAMGAGAELLGLGSHLLYAVVLALVSLILQIYIPYTRYVRGLKWLTLALFTYVLTAFVVHIPWGDALRAIVIPHFSFNRDFITMLAALFGTTISPYLLFWQSAQEVEEVRIVKEDKPLVKAPEQAPQQLGRIEIDTYIGMGFSNLVAFFIMLTTAATLHLNGKTSIASAADAAQALQPVAGSFAALLFSLGIIGTGLLALPVLAGSTAYAIGEALGWRTGLELKPQRARRFYTVLAATMIAGIILNLIPIDPMRALFWAAVINGIAAPPIMAAMMLVGQSSRVMKVFTISRTVAFFGWAATGVMSLVAVLFIVSWF